MVIYDQGRPVSLVLFKLLCHDWGKWQTKKIMGLDGFQIKVDEEHLLGADVKSVPKGRVMNRLIGFDRHTMLMQMGSSMSS